jgi:hypothetical protein
LNEVPKRAGRRLGKTFGDQRESRDNGIQDGRR